MSKSSCGGTYTGVHMGIYREGRRARSEGYRRAEREREGERDEEREKEREKERRRRRRRKRPGRYGEAQARYGDAHPHRQESKDRMSSRLDLWKRSPMTRAPARPNAVRAHVHIRSLFPPLTLSGTSTHARTRARIRALVDTHLQAKRSSCAWTTAVPRDKHKSPSGSKVHLPSVSKVEECLHHSQ